MHVNGRGTLLAARADVFAAICDPKTLLEIIPGCRDVTMLAPDEYRARIALRLPGIVGQYDTLVRLVETEPPARGVIAARLVGKLGGMVGRATFTLHDTDGGTTIEYEGDGTVDGPLARLDSRFLESFAASLVEQGLARLDQRLTAPAPAPAR